MVTIAVTGASASEGTFEFLDFVVELSQASAFPITVSYRTLPGTTVFDDLRSSATASSNNGLLTFAPGETSKTVSIRLAGDSVDEADEHITLELFDPSGAEFSGEGPVLRTTGILLDDDGAGSNLALFVSDPIVVEGDSGTRTATFEIELSQNAPSALSFDYATLDGTATAGSDYTAVSGTLDFAPGQRTASIEVPVLGDTAGEAAEWFSLRLEPTEPTEIDLTDAVGTAEILDTDVSALPQLSIAAAAGEENTFEYLRFVVTLSEPFLDTVTVDYRTLPGTTVYDDLRSSTTSNNNNDTLTFAPGETTKSIFVRLADDSIDEFDESIVVELFNPNSAVFPEGQPTLRATGSVLDDDGTGENRSVFVSDPVIVEGDEGTRLAQFEVRLSCPAESDFSFTYGTIDGTAVAGSDYTSAEGVLDFAPGQDRAVVSVPVLGDTDAEGTEWFSLALAPVTAVPIGLQDTVGTAEILDTDSATLPEVALFGAGGEENTFEYLRFVVTLSEPALDTVTLPYRLLTDSGLNGDVSRPNEEDVLAFAPGETSKSIFVRLSDDTRDEVDENVTLELYDPQGAAFPGDAKVLRANGTILDDDGTGSNLALFVSDPVIVEGDAGSKLAVFDLLLSRPAPTPLSFTYETADGSAKAAEDYTSTAGIVDFVVGQERAAISVPVSGDLDAEADETFFLEVAPITVVPLGLSDSVGMATVLDTDTSPLPEISVTGDKVFEGGDARFVVTLSEPSLETVTLQYATGLGTLSDQELRTVSNTLTFEPGETSKSIFVDTFSDRDDTERDESFHLRLSAAENAVFTNGQTALYAGAFVLDDDNVGFTRALYAAPTAITEDTLETKRVAVPVELSSVSPTPVSFDVGIAPGTAALGIDYELVTQQITFGNFQTRAYVEIDILPDTAVEQTEEFQLTFTPSEGTAFFGTVPTASVAIANASPDLLISSFAIDATSAEDGETVGGTITVENQGTASIVDAEIGFFLSDNATISTEDTDIGTLTVAGALRPGESRQIDLDVTIPQGTERATYFVGAIADPDDAVAELSEDNNGGATDALFVDGVSPDPVRNLDGDNGPQQLAGLSNNDTLRGFRGDDTLVGAGGDDTLDGGAGFDVASFSGDQSSYTITISPGGVTIADRRGDDGTDTLKGIERLAFGDGNWDISKFSDVARLSEDDFRTFVEMYIAYFNRAPDSEGLLFWGTALSTGTNLEKIATLFFDQPETRGLYPGVADLENPTAADLEAFASDVYQNVLGRPFDQRGLDFWVGVLGEGSVSLANFMLEIIRGAKAPAEPGSDPDFVAQKAADVAYLSQKTDIGIYYSVVKGMSDVDDARDIMSGYDGSAASIQTARAEIDAAYAEALDDSSGEFLLSLVGVVDDPFLA